MTCTNLPPRTGQQFSISHGDYHAVVTELGATLRKLTYQGEDIIVSPGPDDMVTCCHGQLLIPFPNRIENTPSKARPTRCRSTSMSAATPSTATASARSGSLSPLKRMP